MNNNEKRKWQIAFRRYVIEKKPSYDYAPYFGLDTENIRDWFALQFDEEMNWDNFASVWHFDHYIPTIYFDFDVEEDLKLCWNFINLYPKRINNNNTTTFLSDLLIAKNYFQLFYEKTNYPIAKGLLDKINSIEKENNVSLKKQTKFVKDKTKYLKQITDFGKQEFELLNKGNTVDEVIKQIELINQYVS